LLAPRDESTGERKSFEECVRRDFERFYTIISSDMSLGN
jgi:hypothetical protein